MSLTTSLKQRILVIGPSNIGDAILAADVFSLLHRCFPKAYLAVVIGSRAKTLFEEDPRIHSIVDAGLFDSFVGKLKLALSLWRYQPHLIVDLRHTLYPFLLKPQRAWRYLIQPPKRIEHMRERHCWKLMHQVPQVARIVKSAEAPSVPQGALQAGERGGLWWSSRDLAQAQTLCKRWQLREDRPLVVICPGARSHIKRWLAEGFASVADRLIQECACEILFSGEPTEKNHVEEIIGTMTQPAHSAVGVTTIRQLGALMARAKVVITNDSASLHLASALGVPTVALFGPTDERKYGPTAARSITVRRRLFCAPCERSLCRYNHECMRFIHADEVFRIAQTFLVNPSFGTHHA
ncbi:MAG: glycosyltransferase family 9 protein [Candidatus Omnitrophica bacterium]|nr:glycosyltransferase family 9 protein [Candidatus Omnitrophota bacterium]